MINLFDTANYPDSEPAELVAGALWGWTRSDITAAYPPASYTLKYRASLQSSPFTLITLTAAKTGGAHIVQETSTGSHTAGHYKWQAVVVRDVDSAEVVVDTGFLDVLAKAVTGTDTSSWVYQVLTAIRETIAGQASKATASYTIKGRTLQSRTLTELLELEREFSKRWQAEQRKAGGNVAKRRTLIGMSA
ncbi:MAG: hypothetical protein M0R02_12395 [Bacteroidales bacterium]|nr:hypothetical protein [Bacteroidales bacterium]